MIQRHFHALRKIHKQNFFQFDGIDRSSICRKTDKKANVDAFLCNLTGRSLQNFLSAVTDLEHTALTGAFCLVTEFCGYFRKTSDLQITTVSRNPKFDNNPFLYQMQSESSVSYFYPLDDGLQPHTGAYEFSVSLEEV